MKPFNNLNAQIEIIRLKRKFGTLYGLTAGVAFAIASWGWDGYMLGASHAYFPWIMFLVGLIFCAILGGITGWLTARSESSLLGTLFWVIASAGFAWLMVALPLQINPALVSKLDPQLGALLNYGDDDQFVFRFGASLTWVLPFMLIIGVTQLPITEPSVFSTSIFSKISPLLFCSMVMVISGSFTDNLINAHFRDAIVSLDATIQFVVDNQGNENINPILLRETRARSLNIVKEHVQESRQLFVGSYDKYLGDLHIFVKFDDQWVDCNVMYNQPVSCEMAAEK